MPYAKCLSQGSEPWHGNNSMLSLSDTPELSDDEGEEGRSLRFSQLACLGMESLPQEPGAKL